MQMSTFLPRHALHLASCISQPKQHFPQRFLEHVRTDLSWQTLQGTACVSQPLNMCPSCSLNFDLLWATDCCSAESGIPTANLPTSPSDRCAERERSCSACGAGTPSRRDAHCGGERDRGRPSTETEVEADGLAGADADGSSIAGFTQELCPVCELE